jgi:hypothetical protein
MEPGKAFADRVEDPVIKIQLLLGGEKTVNGALRQALQMQAMLLAARPKKTSISTFWRSRLPPTRQRNQIRSAYWSCGSWATSGVTAPRGGRQKKTNGMGNKTEDLQETCRNQQQGLNGDQETTER